MLDNHPEQSVSRRVVAESLAQPLADERREADLAGLSGHEAAPCDWAGSQGHAGARKTRMCTAGGALVIVAYAELGGSTVHCEIPKFPPLPFAWLLAVGAGPRSRVRACTWR